NAETLAYQVSSSNIIPVGSDKYEEVLGAYLQQTWTPISEIALNGGVRLDASERYKAVPSPRFAANFGAWRGGTLKFIYSEACRAPSGNEAYSRNDSLAPADTLQPERVRSIESVLEQKLGGQRLLFGVFRSWWSNLIDLHILTQEEITQFAMQRKLPSLL